MGVLRAAFLFAAGPLCGAAAWAQDSLLLVVLDDVGSEYLSWTDEGAQAGQPAVTPTLDSLAAEGVVYDEFWATPVCSSTRAALLTGRYGHRTGIGTLVGPGDELAAAEVTIAERLHARGYPTALFGKWHLGSNPSAPCTQGFDLWDGSQANLGPGSYSFWDHVRDTVSGPPSSTFEEEYATKVVTDAAIDWIDQRTGPWFAAVCYNAAHAPHHDPPGMGPFTTKEEQYRAMIEYMDGDIGRLLNHVDLDQTTVWVLSDNGATDNLAVAPNSAGKSKWTAFRGGVEVACLVAGASVRGAIALGQNTAGQRLPGHAHAVDFYRTALTLMPGTDPGGWPDVDSRRLYLPSQGWLEGSRAWNFTERAEPVGVTPGGPYTELDRAAEEGGYKVRWTTAAVELYDTVLDPWETVDLLANGVSPREQAILDRLQGRLGELGL